MATKKREKSSTSQKVKTAIASTVAAVGIATSVITTVPTTKPDGPKVDKPVVTENVDVITNSEVDKNNDTKTNGKVSDKNKATYPTGDTIVNPDTSVILSDVATTPDIDLTDYTTQIPFELRNESDFAKSIVVNPDDKLSIDIIEMYLGDSLVDYCLIPNTNYITSVPIMFEDLSYLEFKLYRAGEQVGSAVIRDGVMLSNIKEVSQDD